MVEYRDLSMRWKTLICIDRLCAARGRCHPPTLDEIQEELRKRYGVEQSKRQILIYIKELEAIGLVKKFRGMLADGRKVIYIITSEEKPVAFSFIRISDSEAIVYNDEWEGVVYLKDKGLKIMRFEDHYASTFLWG